MKLAQKKTMAEIADVENFDPATVPDGPTEKAKEIMKLLSENIFIISSYMPIKRYDGLIDILLKNMAEGFEVKEFREYPVMYKFYDDPEEEVKSIPFRAFIVNVIMWRPMMCIDPTNLRDEMIINSSSLSKVGSKMIKDYFDRYYVSKYNSFIPTMPDLKLEEINYFMNEFMCDATFQLSRISSIFNIFVGTSGNIEMFIDLEKRIPEFKEVTEFMLDEKLQPAEMEKQMDEQRKKMINSIINDERPNMMKALVQPSSGLKDKQLSDMICNIALKPDEDGRTMQHPINTNYLNKGGLHSPEYYYMNAISGRKAAIINNEYMGKSGHLLILIAIATASAKLSRTTLDCNTVNPIPIEIKTEKHLTKMHGRRYRYPGQREYHILNSHEDKHLIGQTLYFRSPITCACKDGICRECYGDLYYTNIDINNAGIYSATKVMNPVVQGILSAKHHQTTNSSMIEFREEFSTFFCLFLFFIL